MREAIKNSLTVAASLIFSFVICEALFRAYAGVPVFSLSNFRTDQVIRDQLVSALDYDPELGWKLKPHLGEGSTHPLQAHTFDYGVRRNGPGDDHIRTGGVLVTGASFTVGSEVGDADAWPAQLETLIGIPVVNAAEGGYSTDQIILRAEEMLPIVKPKTLIVDIVSDNIVGAGYSFDGYPKPYFTVSDGKLVEHNRPVPRYVPPDRSNPYVRDVLAHSLLIHRFMATFFRDYWYSSASAKFERADNDPVDVTCRLLQRLKSEADARDIRVLLSVEYGGGYLVATTRPDGGVVLVEKCATQLGIQVADEYGRLESQFQKNVDEFKKNYIVESNGLLGHKSPYGNLEVARMVAAALAEPPAERPAASPPTTPSHETAQRESFDHKNLLGPAEYGQLAASSAIVKVTPNSTPGDRTYLLEAAGPAGEHYVAIGNIAIDGGPLTASVDVYRERATSAVRLQLFDQDGDGVYGDVDLLTGDKSYSRLGLGQELGGGVEELGHGWRRVWVTVDLPRDAKRAVIIIQLTDRGSNFGFSPAGEAISVRRLKLERGRSPTAYEQQSTR
jgi:hypothetical protein